MRGANRLQWKFVVMDLARLMMAFGYSTLLLSSYAGLGDLLIVLDCGVKAFIVDCGRLQCFGPPEYPTASTRWIHLAETVMINVGSTFTIIAQCWFFATQGSKSLAWVGVTGSGMVIIAGLLCAVNIYKLQRWNALKEGRIFCRLTPIRI